MATWSSIRHKLENNYLAPSLRGHIQYYTTTYSKSPDHNGRAAIRLDGEEILRGCYYYQYLRFPLFPRDETFERRLHGYPPLVDDIALKLGDFDQHSFYAAFAEFDNQSIENSLNSENLIVRIFAVMDRRVGKRRLEQMKDSIAHEPETFQIFYAIRAKAENL